MPKSALHAHSFWDFYSKLSQRSHRSCCDDFGHALEEQLWETLYAIEKCSVFNTDDLDRLERLPQNRMKKYRRLRLRMAQTAKQFIEHDFQSVDRKSTHDRIRDELPAGAWAVEQQLAGADAYATIANELGISENALKMRVSRWRSKIRAKYPGE